MPTQSFTSCTNCGPITVEVKDGRVVRVRPLVMEEGDLEPWIIKAGGKSYSPPKKVTLAPIR